MGALGAPARAIVALGGSGGSGGGDGGGGGRRVTPTGGTPLPPLPPAPRNGIHPCGGRGPGNRVEAGSIFGGRWGRRRTPARKQPLPPPHPPSLSSPPRLVLHPPLSPRARHVHLHHAPLTTPPQPSFNPRGAFRLHNASEAGRRAPGSRRRCWPPRLPPVVWSPALRPGEEVVEALEGGGRAVPTVQGVEVCQRGLDDRHLLDGAHPSTSRCQERDFCSISVSRPGRRCPRQPTD